MTRNLSGRPITRARSSRWTRGWLSIRTTCGRALKRDWGFLFRSYLFFIIISSLFFAVRLIFICYIKSIYLLGQIYNSNIPDHCYFFFKILFCSILHSQTPGSSEYKNWAKGQSGREKGEGIRVSPFRPRQQSAFTFSTAP